MLQTTTPNTQGPNTPQIIQPGLYVGPGQAQLLRPGQYAYLLNNTNIAAGKASVAAQLYRTSSTFYYPIGFSLEIAFFSAPGVPAAPGAFEVDCQTSDTDQDAYFAKNTSISTVNSGNVCRIEMTNYWALFTRVFIANLTNNVLTTVKITR